MKTILKALPTELLLKYDEKFTSESNTNVLRQLIPWLLTSMKLRYTPSFKQIKD